MEQPKTVETEQKPNTPTQDPHPNPDPKETSSNAPNGDRSWGSFVMGSESQAQAQPQNQADEALDQAAQMSSRKSVHWSPELVSESTFSDNSTSYPQGSNPYIASSPASAPNSSFNFKGSYLHMRIYSYVYIYNYMCVYIYMLNGCLRIS